MESSGQRSNAFIRVQNDRNRPAAIEVSVQTLEIPERGPVVTKADPGDDFLIFPARATVQPGATQIFRIRWVGEPALAQSRMYMFSTAELPVDMTGRGTAVQMLYAINSIVTVAPPRVRPSLSIIGVERASNPEGRPGLNLLVANTSAAHGLFSRATVRVRGAGFDQLLSSTTLSSAVGIGLVPPKARRMFFVPVEGVPNAGSLSATVDLAP
jgi:P pilus assembly chaperone PapD